MKRLIDKPNVSPADSDYPFGNIRDRDGAIPGTPGNVEVYADMHQFFEKMFEESGIVANNNPDNEYHGWQLWEAFLYHVMPKYKLYSDAPTFISEKIQTISGFYKQWNITSAGLTEIDFINNTQTLNIVSFGKNNPYAPVGTVHRLRFKDDPAGSFAFTITINSTNAGSAPPIRKAGVVAADDVWTILIDQVVQIVYTMDGWEIVE